MAAKPWDACLMGAQCSCLLACLGEQVRVELTEDKKNFARGKLVEVLQASAERIDPKCKHFGKCGGCHYQDLPYEKQLAAKTEILPISVTADREDRKPACLANCRITV